MGEQRCVCCCKPAPGRSRDLRAGEQRLRALYPAALRGSLTTRPTRAGRQQASRLERAGVRARWESGPQLGRAARSEEPSNGSDFLARVLPCASHLARVESQQQQQQWPWAWAWASHETHETCPPYLPPPARQPKNSNRHACARDETAPARQSNACTPPILHEAL